MENSRSFLANLKARNAIVEWKNCFSKFSNRAKNFKLGALFSI